MKKKSLFRAFVLVPLFVVFLISSGTVYGSHSSHNDLLDQTTRLTALAKVWGLLKYYHPDVATGQIDWDDALLASIPAVMAAEDYDSFNQEINDLIVQAGDVLIEDYNPGTPANPDTEKIFKWIKNRHIFDHNVRKKLDTMRKKHVPVDNYYVQPNPDGIPSFGNEKIHNVPYYPDTNTRLLALFRYWNAIQYFFPHKNLMDSDWSNVLPEFIPRMLEAEDEDEYHSAMLELNARLNDSHGYSASVPIYRFLGNYYAPVEMRFVENKTVVTHVYSQIMEPAGALQLGDIILECRGMDIETYRDKFRKYMPASNETTINLNLSLYAGQNDSPDLRFKVLRDGQTVNVAVNPVLVSQIYQAYWDELNQLEPWRILPGTNVGYLHMGVMASEHVSNAMTALHNTDAMIFDVRNYPDMIMYDLARFLHPEPTNFVMFEHSNYDFPGSFIMDDPTPNGMDWVNPDYYKGKVIILMNEDTMSRAEFLVMALQTAPQATIIGSQTAGADGDVTSVILPGWIRMYFTSIGVYYPDGTPTQRIGIVPDIYFTPTVSGIAQGRDELLERAMEFIETGE